MSKRLKKLKSKYSDYLLEHPILKSVLSNLITFLGSMLAAFCIAYSYRAFVSPLATIGDNQYRLVAGGVAGCGQVIIKFMEKVGWLVGTPEEMAIKEKTIQSVVIIVVNIPLFILAFFGVGKKFAIYTAMNVVVDSVLISIIPDSWVNIFQIQNDLIARAIFAGVVNGIGISVATELGHSTGGTDVVSMYLGVRKGISIGKYVLIINGTIVLLYTILDMIPTSHSPATSGAATTALYTLIFFFVSSSVIDRLSTRYKKVQLQIVTTEPRLAKVLVQNFPHGATILDGKGAFFDTDKKVILTVISSFELKKATEIIYKIDPHAFITINYTYKILGKFYIKPIR